MKKKTIVNYTLERCVRCMRCVQTCPTSALSMHDNRVTVNDAKCLNCGKCFRACHSKGLLAKRSSLEAIKDYDYTVCLIPGAVTCSCSSLEEAQGMFYAIKQLGFDEVVDITDVEGQLLLETEKMAASHDRQAVISSDCPVVNRMIQERYPMLVDHLAPLEYASEVAAAEVRKRLAGKGNVGIFYFCECEAKLMLAKHPYDNPEYEVDHALAPVDLFPMIRDKLDKGKIDVTFCLEGLQAGNPARMPQNEKYLVADGFGKISDILDMAEFGILDYYDFLYLFPCFNGCIGGHLIWGNSYIYKNNINDLIAERRKAPTALPLKDLSSKEIPDEGLDESVSFLEKMAFFKKVNEQLENLPGYDCSACGMQTCRIMAEEIVRGNKSLDDCYIIQFMREKNGK